MTPTIFIIDDDPSVLRGLTRLLKSSGYAVEASSSAREFLAAPPAGRPGCVIVDLRMPDMGGLELQQALAASGVDLPLIFISGDPDVPATIQALKAGALDFLIKPFEERELLEAVESALARDRERRGREARRRSDESLIASLTPREREVCQLVAQGLANKEIAYRLGTVEKTIKVHRARIMQKLGASSVADLVRLSDRYWPKV